MWVICLASRWFTWNAKPCDNAVDIFRVSWHFFQEDHQQRKMTERKEERVDQGKGKPVENGVARGTAPAGDLEEVEAVTESAKIRQRRENSHPLVVRKVATWVLQWRRSLQMKVMESIMQLTRMEMMMMIKWQRKGNMRITKTGAWDCVVWASAWQTYN